MPEPVLTGPGSDPTVGVEQRELVSIGMLRLLERLNPAERAVFVLRQAFDYSYREIAEVVDRDEAHCRQLQRRAARRLDQPRPSAVVDESKLATLVERSLAAASDGDLRLLEELLAEDATYVADGGGGAGVARRAVIGKRQVARLVAGIARRPLAAATVRPVEVNGERVLVATTAGAIWPAR